ncbi:MAG: MotA/TolQ/ExbB proton channel family protein [Pseudomonadota bacterium]
MTIFSSLKTGILAGAALIAAGTGVAAAQTTSLDDVLRAAREERRQAAQENREREQRFLQERNRQQARLNQVRGEVNAEEARSDALDEQFRANDAQIQELTNLLQERQGEFGELFGAARSGAAELAAQLDNSIISGELPGRSAQLRETAQATSLPSVEELRFIVDATFDEMAAQAKVATFESSVSNAAGERETVSVTRIGPFSAFADGKYYIMSQPEGGSPRLTELARQPEGNKAVPNARAVANYTGSGYTEGTIDPTTGTLLSLVVLSPNLSERFEQGGPVGKAIAGVFVAGFILGIYKWFTLFMTNSAVRGQVRRKTPSRGNPLGRVMMAYDSNTGADVETLSLKLDDAVLKELPKLESGLNLIKVIAAIAPLMGLLGTVVGMIITFQQITLFGTGDPQIMAGGISQALVTTVLGLIAAIPLLLLHAFASGSAKSVSQTLEEQAAGMIAEHAESRA